MTEASRYEEFCPLDFSNHSLVVMINWGIVRRFQEKYGLTGIREIRSEYWSKREKGLIERLHIWAVRLVVDRKVNAFGGRYEFPTKTLRMFPDAVLMGLLSKRVDAVQLDETQVDEAFETLLTEGASELCFVLAHEFGHAAIGQKFFRGLNKTEKMADKFAEEHLDELEGAFKVEERITKK